MNQSQFTKLLQIGLLVEDLESAVKHFQEDYGLGPWRYDDMDASKIEGMLVNGEKTDLMLRGAFCSALGFELELIQPVSESPLRDWVREHGSGLHHLGMATRDGFRSVVGEYERRTGKKPWFRLDIGDDAHFAYLDLRGEIGCFVEVFDTEGEKEEK